MPNPADVYEPQYLPPDYKVANPNYSGYDSESSRGEKLVLRANNGNKIRVEFLLLAGDDRRHRRLGLRVEHRQLQHQDLCGSEQTY